MASGNPHGLILYDHPSSPCARRCRIALHEKRLAWDTQTIDLARLQQRDPEYLAINPNGFVPALAHGERVLHESNVITEYLDDVFPETPLYPEDAWELAQVKMWQSAEAAMAKDYRPLMYQRLLGPMLRLTRTLEEALEAARRSTRDAADLAWERRVWSLAVLTPAEEVAHEERLRSWLERLERHLDGREFLVGTRFTQADASVYPRVAMLPFVWVRIDPERSPNVARWAATMARRASFHATLSAEDRALSRLARTPILPWLSRVLRAPEDERTRAQRAGLAVLRRLARRALAPKEAGRDGSARRPIRKPSPGTIPPRAAPARGVRSSRPLPPALRDAPIVLHDDPRSPHGRRVRIVLLEKGLSWTTVLVDLGRMAQKAPAYLAVNPNGEVPALVHGDRTLHDSQVIAEYLDRTFPSAGSPPLYPEDAFERARVRMWLALEAGTHKELRPLFYLHVIRPDLVARGVRAGEVDSWVPEGVPASHRAWLRDTLEGRPRFDSSEELARGIVLAKLDHLEAALVGREYLVGEGFTMADAAWLTRVEVLPAMGVPVSGDRFPSLLRWRERLHARPSVAASRECAGPSTAGPGAAGPGAAGSSTAGSSTAGSSAAAERERALR